MLIKNVYLLTIKIVEIKSLFAKYFLDGSIGKHTWNTVKKPELDDYTAHFEKKESSINLCGLSKVQYAELGYNPIRDEFELVCMNFNFQLKFNFNYCVQILMCHIL